MIIVAVIPARMGSTRFPGKPLTTILGMPMVEHVYRRTALCEALDSVYVATCDEEIRRAVEAFGGRVIMTSPKHTRASERVAEAAQHVDADVVVMVQGDEPMITPEMVDLAIGPFFGNPDVRCVNLVARIETEVEFLDPNSIKVVMNRHGDALYFSREPIPTSKKIGFDAALVFKQVCVIPFRRDFLFAYKALAPTPLEEAESIDMLRILEHGYSVRLVETRGATYAVDTSTDLEKVEALLRNDPLLARYMSGESQGAHE